jgi:hypothetical protein
MYENQNEKFSRQCILTYGSCVTKANFMTRSNGIGYFIPGLCVFCLLLRVSCHVVSLI